MSSGLYYNQSSYDSEKGGGYGKSQKLPSLGTGLGSERPVGSSVTGIYPEPDDYEFSDEEKQQFEDETFSDQDTIDRFVAKINKWRPRFDISRRADRGSFTNTSNRYDLAEASKMPTAKKSIAPFSSRVLYPKGFSGPPVGSGGAGQAFKTTGPYKRTGTQYGTSRAPIIDIEDDYVHHFSLRDLLDDTEDDALRKNSIRTKRIRHQQDENQHDDDNGDIIQDIDDN